MARPLTEDESWMLHNKDFCIKVLRHQLCEAYNLPYNVLFGEEKMDYRNEKIKNRTHVTDEIAFREELMNKLFNSVYSETAWKKEQVKADIRLRRELNNLRKFMEENRNIL